MDLQKIIFDVLRVAEHNNLKYLGSTENVDFIVCYLVFIQIHLHRTYPVQTKGHVFDLYQLHQFILSCPTC